MCTALIFVFLSDQKGKRDQSTNVDAAKAKEDAKVRSRPCSLCRCSHQVAVSRLKEFICICGRRKKLREYSKLLSINISAVT